MQKQNIMLAFGFLDKLAEKKGKPFKPGNGQYVFMEDNKNEIIFMKPTTGMNKSGLALKQVANQYRLKTSDICVIVDDVDLPLGKLRIKPKGGRCHRRFKYYLPLKVN